jgi:hypothetical protein
VGALAFPRTGDPATGEFQDGVILARFGEVDLDFHSATERRRHFQDRAR